MSVPALVGLDVADEPARWQALGFQVERGRLRLGTVELRLGVPGHGITGWTLSGIAARADIDGLRTTVAADTDGDGPAGHDNGAVGLDHVVVLTPDFERTGAALAGAGLSLRRVAERGGVRQGFRRLGSTILELVERHGANGAATFWGLVVVVEDLDGLATRLADRLGTIRPAVQPGRRIATLRSSAGLSAAVAFMDPEPSARR
jgi:hypothetical protein